jgi:glycosyltransferase involved in cell wall biosynthesis
LPATLDELRGRARLITAQDPVLGSARVFHVGSPFEHLLDADVLVPPVVRSAGSRLVATLYDLIPLVLHHDYLATGYERALYRRGLELVRACDGLVAISEATAADAERLLSIRRSRITVAGAGASDIFHPPAVPTASVITSLQQQLPGVRPGYIFLPSGIDPRKNWREGLTAYASLDHALRRRHQLVLTCRVDDVQRRMVAHVASDLGIVDDLLVTGVVDDDVLVSLYQGAHVVLFPSRYEGFGLPPLEARLCGAPVVCGDNSSLREVITDPAARFDADDPVAIATVLRRVLTDESFRMQLLATPPPPFTWDLAAQRTAERYEALLREPHR